MPKFLRVQNIKVISLWLAMLVGWEVVVDNKLIISKAFFASPSQILSEFTRFDFWKIIAVDSANTLSLIVISLFLGYIIAQVFILLSLYSKTLYQLFYNLDHVWKYFPIPALIPFGILFFGLGVGSKIFILTFCTVVLYLSHCIKTIEIEEKSYKLSQISWNINPFQRFRYFVFPLTNTLNYRVWSSLVVWVFGVVIIAEMLLGGVFGLGIRLLQYQQLYQTSRLFAYLVVIIVLSFSFEFVLSHYFKRLKNDLTKKLYGGLMLLSVLFSFGFQVYTNVSTDKSRVIVTYKAGLNLPLMVYAQKYNSLHIKLQFVASGIQVMDTLQANKTDIGGFADMPNVLTGINKNSDLKIAGQVVETKDRPTLFLISRKHIDVDNYAELAGTKIAYSPNNPLIKNGLDFTLFSKGTLTSQIEYSSSSDPYSLVQAFNSGKYDSFLGPEPFVTQIEHDTGLKRINSQNSLISGIDFTALPLAALALNIKNVTHSDQVQFTKDIKRSLDYIRDHTSDQHKASGELKSILLNYELPEDISLSAFEIGSEIDLENTKKLVQLINLFDSQNNLSVDKVGDIYL